MKHHTETAFVIALGAAIALTGALATLLPPLPDGFLYWGLLMLLAVAYPLSLRPFFRSNRADHEFRVLHWTPALMLVLWFLVDVLSGFGVLTILKTGFFFAWALPLAVLGIGLLMLFSWHALRRWQTRIPALAVVLVAAAVFGIASEVMAWNPPLTAAIYQQRPASKIAATHYEKFVASVTGGTPRSPVAVVTTDTAKPKIAVIDSGTIRVQDPATPPVTRKVERLPKSGPEDVAAILFASLLGLYCFVVHSRAQRRVLESA